MELKDFIDLNLLPNTYKLSEKKVVSISEWKSLPSKEQKIFVGRIVVDNYDWVAENEKYVVSYCSDSHKFSKCDKQKYVEQRFNDKMLTTEYFVGLTTIDSEKIKTNERRHVKMSEVKPGVNKDLGKLDINLDEIDAELNRVGKDGVLEDSNEFGEKKGTNTLTEEEKKEREAKKEAKERALEKGKHTLERYMDDKLQSCPELYAFNKALGRLICTVTQKDKCVTVSTKSVDKKDAEGNKIAKQQVAIEGAVGATKQEYEKESLIVFKEKTPGKSLGAVISIPEGGRFTFGDLRGEKRVLPKEDKKDLAYFLFSMEEVFTVLPLLFNGEIKESEEVMGAGARMIQVVSNQVTKTEKNTSVVVVRNRLQANVASGSKKVLRRNNYFPIETFETIDMLSMSQEDCDKLNKTYFGTWTTKSKNATESKYEKLSLEERAKLVVNESNQIVGSSFFRTQDPERVVVKQFDDKDVNLTSIRIPYKEERLNESTGKTTSRYVTVKCTDKESENSPLNSLKSREFSKIVAACNDALTVEALSTLTATKAKGPKAGVVSAEELRNLQATFLDTKPESRNGIYKIEGFGNTMNLADFTSKLKGFDK